MKSCDKRPLRHRHASPYIGCIRRIRESTPSFPRRQEPRIPAPCPRHSSEGWNPSEGEGSGDKECNQMQSNATELKVSLLLATPPSLPAQAGTSYPGPAQTIRNGRKWKEMEANKKFATPGHSQPAPGSITKAKRGQRGLTVARCIRVNGVPNEATVAPFPASPVGVNEAKQGQMGPGFNPPPPIVSPDTKLPPSRAPFLVSSRKESRRQEES